MFTSVNSVVPIFEARSEAWVLITWVWYLRFGMKPCSHWVSFQRTANCGTVSCLSQDYPIYTWEDSFSLSWLAQGSIACAGFGEQLGRLLSGTLALKRSFRSLRVPRRECIDFPLAVLATHPSSGFCKFLKNVAEISRKFHCWFVKTDFLLNNWIWSGRKVCNSCRAWKMLSNDVKRILTCKISFWYSRERARQIFSK